MNINVIVGITVTIVFAFIFYSGFIFSRRYREAIING